MTIQSVLWLIGRFVHALCTVVGAFFLLYWITATIIRYSFAAENPITVAAWPFIPAMIFAAVYTWRERPRKFRNDHTF
jgi:hypothetical protein